MKEGNHRIASIAALSGKTLGVFLGDKIPRSSHFLNARLHSSERPYITTLLLGRNGRSCKETAIMPYSWANISAEANSAERAFARSPTMLLKSELVFSAHVYVYTCTFIHKYKNYRVQENEILLTQKSRRKYPRCVYDWGRDRAGKTARFPAQRHSAL